MRKACSHKGCKKQAQNKDVCVKHGHGAKMKCCSHGGCTITNQVVKGGACSRSHWPPHETGR